MTAGSANLTNYKKKLWGICVNNTKRADNTEELDSSRYVSVIRIVPFITMAACHGPQCHEVVFCFCN